jgi:hypothetical protein
MAVVISKKHKAAGAGLRNCASVILAVLRPSNSCVLRNFHTFLNLKSLRLNVKWMPGRRRLLLPVAEMVCQEWNFGIRDLLKVVLHVGFFTLTDLCAAPTGQTGNSGKSAGAPTAGQPASDIRVRLAYSSEEPGITQVTGEGPHTGQLWKISRAEKLKLDAKGGDGGAGGRGQDGQAGGRGRDGRDATKHRNGENGEHGASGGE